VQIKTKQQGLSEETQRMQQKRIRLEVGHHHHSSTFRLQGSLQKVQVCLQEDEKKQNLQKVAQSLL